MSNNDIVVGATTTPNTAVAKKTPPHLITLEQGSGKTKSFKFFIALDKPTESGNFVNVKGIFCDAFEEDIIKSFNELLTSSPKELFCEMSFPSAKICSIRNLIFRAK